MIYKRKLFRIFSHLDGKTSTRNFHLYVLEASEIMEEKAIKKQLSQSWSNLISEIDKYEEKFEL